MTARAREPRYTRADLTLANAFTLLRLLLVPLFCAWWLAGENERALWVFATAAVTDFVDGFLARFLNQKSNLGALLDPLADKALMLTAWLTGTVIGVVPPWLTVAVLLREAILGLGALALTTVLRGRHEHGPTAWRPTRVGKWAMLAQTVCIVLVLVESSIGPAALRPWVRVTMLLTSTLVAVSLLQYAVRAVTALAGQSAESGRQ